MRPADHVGRKVVVGTDHCARAAHHQHDEATARERIGQGDRPRISSPTLVDVKGHHDPRPTSPSALVRSIQICRQRISVGIFGLDQD
jgi:hypothetical protein